jgi:hypothetical protein
VLNDVALLIENTGKELHSVPFYFIYWFISRGSEINFILLVALLASGIINSPQIKATGNMVPHVVINLMSHPGCKP